MKTVIFTHKEFKEPGSRRKEYKLNLIAKTEDVSRNDFSMILDPYISMIMIGCTKSFIQASFLRSESWYAAETIFGRLQKEFKKYQIELIKQETTFPMLDTQKAGAHFFKSPAIKAENSEDTKIDNSKSEPARNPLMLAPPPQGLYLFFVAPPYNPGVTLESSLEEGMHVVDMKDDPFVGACQSCEPPL